MAEVEVVDVEVALSEYFAGNDNDSGVSQWGCGWQSCPGVARISG